MNTRQLGIPKKICLFSLVIRYFTLLLLYQTNQLKMTHFTEIEKLAAIADAGQALAKAAEMFGVMPEALAQIVVGYATRGQFTNSVNIQINKLKK